MLQIREGGRMSPKAYLSYSAAVILQALANGYQYGFDIMDITGLPSGTVYPPLRRLQENGFVGFKLGERTIRPTGPSTPPCAGSKRPDSSIRNGRKLSSPNVNNGRRASTTS